MTGSEKICCHCGKSIYYRDDFLGPIEGFMGWIHGDYHEACYHWRLWRTERAEP